MTSYRIWIPSMQKYIRMFEINCEQFRNLLKTIEDDIEFEFSIIQLLTTNLFDKSINLADMTIIDKFVILLQLKIHSCSPKLTLTRSCEKCETKTSTTLDLNNIINELAQSIDRSFTQSFSSNSLIVTCDIPSIKLENDDEFGKKDFDKKLDNYLYSFIKNIMIGEQIINLDKMSQMEKISICECISFETMMDIKMNYIDNLHNIFRKLLLVKIKCGNESCGDELQMNFDINNMNDVIRVLFRDTSAVNVLGQYANLSTNCHLDFSFYKNISPAELEIIGGMIEKNEEAAPEAQSNRDINLFDKYRMESEGMVENPSEFR
jgi:hypothetical protein